MTDRSRKKPLTAREAALTALVRVDQDSSYLNLTLPPLLVHLSPRDRGLASRIASGTMQHLNTIDWALSLFMKSPMEKLTPHIRSLLRLSAYQLLYLDRIPAHAAVDEAVRLAGRFGHRGVAGLANAVLRRLAAQKEDLPWPDMKSRPAEALALHYSHPLWMVRRWINIYGQQEAEKLCRANNEPAPVSLRPNTLRTDAMQLKTLLGADGVEAVHSPVAPGLLVVNLQQSPADLDSFRKGLFTVQGESSALVAPLAAPAAGRKVLDLCSAPGGKTTHLAELMQDSGAVLAADLHPHRLRLVEEAARRLGLSSIRTMVADGREIGRSGLALQDRILVDAPCSGLGVIRRLPELKWRRGEEHLPKMHKLQLELLEAASQLLSAGGMLVYSVCSNEPEETAAVVAAFSAKHPQMALQPEIAELPAALSGAVTRDGVINLLPHRHRVDGFFIARWIRRAVAPDR